MHTVTWSLASAGLAGPPSAEAPAACTTVPADAGAADADRPWPARPAEPGWPGEPWLPRAAVPAADLVAAAAVSSVTCDPSAGRAAPVCDAGRRGSCLQPTASACLQLTVSTPRGQHAALTTGRRPGQRPGR